MIESYYTPEQLQYLKNRRAAVGEDRMQQAPADWSALTAAFRTEMAQGADPTDPQVQELAKRWQVLVDEFTGGDAGVEESLKRLWAEQGENLAAQYGYDHDPALLEFTGKAVAAFKAAGS